MQHTTFFAEPVQFHPPELTGTFYDYLGVDRLATTESIKRAFVKLLLTTHPDKNPDIKEKATFLFQQLLEAYE